MDVLPVCNFGPLDVVTSSKCHGWCTMPKLPHLCCTSRNSADNCPASYTKRCSPHLCGMCKGRLAQRFAKMPTVSDPLCSRIVGRDKDQVLLFCVWLPHCTFGRLVDDIYSFNTLVSLQVPVLGDARTQTVCVCWWWQGYFGSAADLRAGDRDNIPDV